MKALPRDRNLPPFEFRCLILEMYFKWQADPQLRAKMFASIVYLGAAAAVEIRFVLVHHLFEPGEFDWWVFVIPILALGVFVASYTRLLLDSAIRPDQKLGVFIANTFVLAGILYVSLADRYIFSDSPFDRILGSYVIPVLLLSIAGTMWLGWKHGFLGGSLVSLLFWPTLGWLAQAQGILSYPLAARDLVYALGCLSAQLVLVAAVIVIRSRRRRLGDLLALLASAMAWPLLVRIERSYLYSANAWNMFNSGRPEVLAYAKINLITLLFLILATVCTLVRLLPANLSLRAIPLRDRVSPVLAISLLVVTVWFGASAWPYVVPEPHHGVLADIVVSHVQKRGLHFQETEITFFRDSKAYVAQNERKPLRYHAREMYYSVLLPAESLSRIKDLYRSAQFHDAGTLHRSSPRQWNSDTWYVYQNGGLSAIFSDVHPPEELLRWFEQTEKLPPQSAASPTVINDVCLGFCYDPARR